MKLQDRPTTARNLNKGVTRLAINRCQGAGMHFVVKQIQKEMMGFDRSGILK